MRRVATLLAAAMAASILTISAPAAQAATAPTPGIAAAPTTSDPQVLSAHQKRQQKLAKKRALIAKKKRLAKKRAAARGKKIVRHAAKYKGTPYVWGGTSPSGFDCSGYVQYVLKKSVKKKMPRIAGDQMKKGKSVAKSKKKKGDLIGFTNGSGYYHIGIYAGDGKIWHAPRPGKRVEKVKIWTSAYKVRRV